MSTGPQDARMSDQPTTHSTGAGISRFQGAVGQVISGNYQSGPQGPDATMDQPPMNTGAGAARFKGVKGAGNRNREKKSLMDHIGVASVEDLVKFSGFWLLVLLCVIPMMNAIEMLSNENLYFWIGPAVPWGLLASCIVLMLAYVVASHLFFSRRKNKDHEYEYALHPDWRDDYSIFILLRSFIGAFAILLMLQSFPLHSRTSDASRLLLNECAYNRQTTALQSQYQQLRAMRNSDSCGSQRSVELCDGFHANDYTNYLKWAEEEFQCTGMCAEPAIVSTPTTPREVEEEEEEPPITTPEPLTDMVSPADLGAVGRALVEVRKHNGKVEVEKKVMKKFKKANPVPITGNALFSSYTYTHHCAHMVASDLKNQGSEMAQSAFIQGAILLIMVIVSNFVDLVQGGDELWGAKN